MTAAVEKRKEQRKPAAFFGHRKADSCRGTRLMRGVPLSEMCVEALWRKADRRRAAPDEVSREFGVEELRS